MSDIFDAVRAGDAAAAAAILETDPEAVRLRDEAGLTPVMLAAYARKQEMLALLLGYAAAGLDVFEAAIVGAEPRMTELIASDATCAYAYSVDGYTPLHLAAFFAREGSVKTLLAHGANARVASRNGMRVTPLHSAVAARQNRIAAELIAAGADVNARQQGGFTALHGAAQNGDEDIVSLLLASGADPSAITDDGRTAAELAREQGHAQVAQLVQP